MRFWKLGSSAVIIVLHDVGDGCIDEVVICFLQCLYKNYMF